MYCSRNHSHHTKPFPSFHSTLIPIILVTNPLSEKMNFLYIHFSFRTPSNLISVGSILPLLSSSKSTFWQFLNDISLYYEKSSFDFHTSVCLPRNILLIFLLIFTHLLSRALIKFLIFLTLYK